MESISALVRRVPIFASLDTAHLAALARAARRESVPAGAPIFRAGEPGTALHVITAGAVRISLQRSAGEDVTLAVLGPGDFFGELAVLDGHPRSADALAMSDCEMLTISREDVLALLRAEPRAALAMLSTLGTRLRQADELIESLLREVLSGFIPICAWCRRIQAETGDWHPLETYVLTRTSAQLTHGICPDCEARARELGKRER